MEFIKNGVAGMIARNRTGKLLSGRTSEMKQGKKVKLFCFPHAGGSASFYNDWIGHLEGGAWVCPIQLPGRENRIAEEAYVDMELLVSDLMEEILQLADGNTVFFGHSMGAKIAYETAKALEKQGTVIGGMIVSGSGAPEVPPKKIIYGLPDPQFKAEIRRLSGTPREVLENEDWMNFFVPMLRADFTLDETYAPKECFPLHCPIAAWGGETDTEALREEIALWKSYTYMEAAFALKLFPGGHFFLKEEENHMLHELKMVLQQWGKLCN